MNLHIYSKGFKLTDAIREYAESRTRYAITRISYKVSSVKVILSDENGPRGGVDKKCQISLKMEGFNDLVVQEMDEDLYEAISRCTVRLRRVSQRKVERMRDLNYG
jgi:putative sigma-54 modulation protein